MIAKREFQWVSCITMFLFSVMPSKHAFYETLGSPYLPLSLQSVALQSISPCRVALSSGPGTLGRASAIRKLLVLYSFTKCFTLTEVD